MFGKSKGPEPAMSSGAAQPQEMQPTAAPAEGCINAQTVIKGEIQFQGVMHVEGHVEGPITGDGKIHTHAGSTVVGAAVAAEIMVGGNFHGNITATQSVRLEPTARVVGDIQAPKVKIAEGATLQGNCIIGSDDGGAAGEEAPMEDPDMMGAPDEEAAA